MPAFPHGGGGKAAAYRRARPPGRRGGKEETADVPASPRGGQEAAKPAPIRGRRARKRWPRRPAGASSPSPQQHHTGIIVRQSQCNTQVQPDEGGPQSRRRTRRASPARSSPPPHPGGPSRGRTARAPPLDGWGGPRGSRPPPRQVGGFDPDRRQQLSPAHEQTQMSPCTPAAAPRGQQARPPTAAGIDPDPPRAPRTAGCGPPQPLRGVPPRAPREAGTDLSESGTAPRSSRQRHRPATPE